MRILFITHYFQPEPNFFFGLPFAKELVRRGHQVEVITGFPNYPGGKIYDGYKIKLFQKEIMDGITVYRFPLYPSHDRSSLKRILCYASLSVSMALMAPWIVSRADVAYVVQGPATLGWPAIILKWFRHIPFVYNIQDIWPDSLLSTGMFNKGFAYKIIDAWCKFVYARASVVSVIAPGMKKMLVKRGVPQDKIEVLYNWCDEELVCRVDRDENLSRQLGFSGKFNIVFAGNMGKAQALEAVVKAAAIVQPEYPDIQFVFIGSGVEVEKLQSLVKQKQLTNVLFIPRKPVSEIGPILSLADMLLVHLRKDPLFAITIPSKTQAYLASGRPVLMAVEGDAANLINQAQAGISCEPENPNAIAEAIKEAYNMTPLQRQQLGENGRKYYDNQLSFSVAVNNYEQLFEKLTGNIDKA
ncbi:MAG: glycosyltransferase family 4 protein [Planctomycetes bacterium]|nr:glycosyltransferase family 4 protein [Planctomycetota bacterium]